MANRWLDRVERLGNRLPEPLSLFVLLAALVALVSALLAGLSLPHPVTGEPVVARSLLSRELSREVILIGAVRNFTGFAPLGLVLVAMIGIGIAERSGLVSATLRILLARSPHLLLSYGVVLAGVLSSFALDAGYVVVVPLGAALFAQAGRHPIAGLAAGFAGVSGGFSANVVVTAVDALLAGLTTEAARAFDPTYEVVVTSNLFFMATSVLLVVAAGGWVTDRVVEPRLGTWDTSRATSDARADRGGVGIGARERGGLAAALVALGAVALLVALLALPAEAPLRADDGSFGPLWRAMVPLILLAFGLPGIAYGAVVGTIRSDRDVARMGGETMAAMGPYVLLAFAMAQFVEYFRASNLGTLLAIAGADGLRDAGLGGAPLLLGFLLVAALVNLFLGSASAKWAVMGPVFVPMLMALGYSPELVQATYRIGDSVTNIVTPLMPYFPIAVAFGRRYDDQLGLGTLISVMLPYSLCFGLVWAGALLIWATLGIPLGPGAPLTYPS
jgi:aminobenzoyl-glutamate transport protein